MLIMVNTKSLTLYNTLYINKFDAVNKPNPIIPPYNLVIFFIGIGLLHVLVIIVSYYHSIT